MGHFTIKQLFTELEINGMPSDRMQVGSLAKNEFLLTNSDSQLSRVDEDGLQVLCYPDSFRSIVETIIQQHMDRKQPQQKPTVEKRKRKRITTKYAVEFSS